MSEKVEAANNVDESNMTKTTSVGTGDEEKN